MNIRLEAPTDYRAAEELTREAFWNHFEPGANEHYLVHTMRGHPDFLPELCFVAEENGVLVGHIAYNRAKIAGEDGAEYPVLCFGPLSVLPKYQGKGVGSALVRHTLELAKAQGHTAVLIMGNPNFYGRLGFRCGERYDIRHASGKFMPALLAYELIPGALDNRAGRFLESPLFEMDMEGFDVFDATFPRREKREGGKSQEEFRVLSGLMYG